MILDIQQYIIKIKIYNKLYQPLYYLCNDIVSCRNLTKIRLLVSYAEDFIHFGRYFAQLKRK